VPEKKDEMIWLENPKGTELRTLKWKDWSLGCVLESRGVVQDRVTDTSEYHCGLLSSVKLGSSLASDYQVVNKVLPHGVRFQYVFPFCINFPLHIL
jgi:hypothetical protein